MRIASFPVVFTEILSMFKLKKLILSVMSYSVAITSLMVFLVYLHTICVTFILNYYKIGNLKESRCFIKSKCQLQTSLFLRPTTENVFSITSVHCKVKINIQGL